VWQHQHTGDSNIMYDECLSFMLPAQLHSMLITPSPVWYVQRMLWQTAMYLHSAPAAAAAALLMCNFRAGVPGHPVLNQGH
jgi:hypothetical protein